MTSSSLEKRLSIVPEQELEKLLSMFKAEEMPVFNAGMTRHFEIAKAKPDEFVNHPPVLGISFGGTNTKIVLASMKGGELMIHRVSAAANPAKPIHVYDFFDEVLMGDPVFLKYLQSPSPVVGISVPTRVLGKIPFHETKVPTIDGLLARNESMMTDEYDLSKSFAKYLSQRGLSPAVLFYQGDGIVAHHGAVSLSEMGVDDRSVLFVCGTGMATGDEEAYIQAGIARMLNNGDEELYPASATENHQYHYAAAGKGIFNLMERAIRIRAAEPGSALCNYDLAPYFADNHGSRTVGQIWWSGFEGQQAEGVAGEIQALVSPEAYRELQALAGWIMTRCVHSMANTAVATIAKMGRAPSGNGHIVFFEGSIANDRFAHGLLIDEILRLVSNEALYVPFGLEAPLVPNMAVKYRCVRPLYGVSAEDMKKVDLTAIGAATMAMAQNLS
jgi:hypothetical protein